MSAVTGTFDSTTPNKTADDAQPECTTTIPDKYGWVPLGSCNSYYFSVPDFNSAVAFALLFGVFTIVQLFQAFVLRRRYCWVLIMGGIWETTSFALRAVGQRNQQSQVISTLSTLLLLLFPLWINAFAYMTAGRLIHCFSPTHAALGIRAIKIGRTFVWCDIFSFIVQIIGGLLLMPGNNVDSIRLGLKIYMGGVGLQQLSILGFSALIWRFHWKKKNGERVYSTIYKDEGDRERDRRGKWSLCRRWEVLVWALYAVLALITIRITYRLVEFAGGFEPTNKVLYNENYLLYLDGLPMLLAVLVLTLIHPGAVLQGPDSSYPKKLHWWTWGAKREFKRATKKRRIGKGQPNCMPESVQMKL